MAATGAVHSVEADAAGRYLMASLDPGARDVFNPRQAQIGLRLRF